MRWAALLLLLLLAPTGAAQSGTAADPTPGPSTWTREDFDHEAPDGVVLKASVWRPNGGDGQRFPAVLTTHGWPGRHDEGATVRFGEHLASLGYIVVAWTARGFGESGGEASLNGPAEVADAMSFVDFVLGEPTIALDGPGDPRVGMVGISYGGGIQVLASQADARIDAIVPITTWSNLLQSLAPNDVFKAGWTTLLYTAGTAETHGFQAGAPTRTPTPDLTGGAIVELNRWYVEAMTGTGPTDELREQVGVVRSFDPTRPLAPALLVQGWRDTLFPAQEAIATSAARPDARLLLYDGGHGGFYRAWDDARWMPVQAEIDAFLATHLKGEPPALPPYPVLRYRYQEEDFVGELQWPPANTTHVRLYLTPDGLADAPVDGTLAELVVAPAPAGCNEVPNFQASQGPLCPRADERTAATFWTDALAGLEVTGTPVLSLDAQVTGAEDARFIVTLVDGGDAEAPVLAQAMPYKAGRLDGTPLPLATVTHTVAEGHRLGLRIATSDLAYKGSQDGGQATLVGPAWVDIPVVPKDAFGDRAPPRLKVLLAPEDRTVDAAGAVPDTSVDETAIVVAAGDDWDVVSVRAFADGLVVDGTRGLPRSEGEDPSWLVTLPFGNMPGSHRVTLVALDPAGRNATLEVGWTVSPGPAAQPADDGEGTPALPMVLAAAALALVAEARRRRR